MRKIKFRAIDLYTDDYVYGYPFKHFFKKWWINPEDTMMPNVSVSESTIQQLIGYDADGNEIYEGDILLDAGGNEHVAVFQPPDFSNFTLKPKPLKPRITVDVRFIGKPVKVKEATS